MYSRWFSQPDPGFMQLVTRLYGPQTGAGLYATYREQLSCDALWQWRLEWEGLAIYEEDEIVAHAIVQRIKDKPLVYVGYVEAVDSPEAAALLVQSVKERLRLEEPGKPICLPVNLSIWHSYRFKTWGEGPLPFEAPCMPYYGRLFGDLLAVQEFYSSYRMALPMLGPGGADSHLRVRELSLSDLMADLRTLYNLSGRIFTSEHSDPRFEEFAAIYSGMPGGAGIDPSLVLIAEDEAGHAVGFIFAVAVRHCVFVKTFGVLPEARHRGVASLLYGHVCERARRLGCDTMYGLMIRNDRPVTRLLPRGATRVAEYVLFKDRT